MAIRGTATPEMEKLVFTYTAKQINAKQSTQATFYFKDADRETSFLYLPVELR